MKLAQLLVLLSAASGCYLAAQTTPTFDNSGNGLLKGTYYFREVAYVIGDNAGDLSQAVALYGTITFSGSGTYTIAATVLDSMSGLQSVSVPGTYTISASGYGFLSSPLSSGDSIFGLVSQQGIFIGSSTENGFFNDLFIAAPLASPAPTAATFKGSYWVSDIDLSGGTPANAIGTLFQLNPDGAGSLGNVALSGYFGQNGSSLITQSAPSVRYSFSNGAASVIFPSSNTLLVSGQKFLYISPDGNFVFGGSPNSWDMFVGVRTATGTPALGGLYYQAGIDENDSNLASGFGDLDTYFGSFSASGGSIVGHQRWADVFNSNPVDLTYSDVYTVKSDGTYSTSAARYVVGAGGVRIGSGIGPFLGLNVALPAPVLSGTGVFLNPQGVVNNASSAPFTAAIAPGELLTLYGTGLTNDTQLQIAPTVPFPNILDGVQVMINGVAAPLYYVSATQIAAIVPYSATTPVAQIQVVNNGAVSNIVTAFTTLTAPGIFTVPSGGLGNGAVLHSDYSLVTTTHPALVGETVSVFLTGLGAVLPAIPDGSAGPISPYSLATSTITAFVGGIQAAVGYAGLAPGSAGLYQVNLTIPTGVTTGSNALDISGPDSYTSEAVIPVTTTTGSTATAPAPQSLASRLRKSAQRQAKFGRRLEVKPQ